MYTIDVINVFLSFWFKPMLMLIVVLSVANVSYFFSASASHWFLFCGFVASVGGVLWGSFLPTLSLAILPQSLSPYAAVDIFSNIFQSFSTVSLLVITAYVFILGAVWVGFFQAYGYYEISKITANSSRVRAASVRSILTQLSATLTLQKVVEVRVSNELESPVVWGYRSPVILLPKGYERWSDDRLTRVLLHELAHVQRKDWLIKSVSKACCAVFWFVPMVWYVAAKIEWFAELCCDDIVVTTLSCRAEYAEDLLVLSTVNEHSSWVLAFTRNSDLYLRIQHVLDGRFDRQRISAFKKVVNACCCCLLSLPLCFIHAKPADVAVDGDAQPYTYPLNLPEVNSAPRALLPEASGNRYGFALIKVVNNRPKITEEMIVSSRKLSESRLSVVPTENTDVLMGGTIDETITASTTQKQAVPFPHLEVKGMLPRVMFTPEYPTKAIRKGIEGKVIVQFDIDVQGQITAPRIVHAQPKKVFDKAVLKALARSSYTPMTIDGEAIITKNVSQTFNFKLYESATEDPSVPALDRTQMAELDE